MAAGIREAGLEPRGFDAYVQSRVLPGSGLSSSAAFEVLMGTVLNGLCGGKLDPVAIARIGQRAENLFFGKPCGLMDQTASAVGNIVAIDFENPESPRVEPVDFDFSACGHALCIIDSGEMCIRDRAAARGELPSDPVLPLQKPVSLRF